MNIKLIAYEDMKQISQKNLLDIMKKTNDVNDIQAYADIIGVLDEWKTKILNEFLYYPLVDFAQKNKLIIEKDKNNVDYKFRRCNWEYSHIVIGIDDERKKNYYSIWVDPKCDKKRKAGKLSCFDKEPDLNKWDYLPYGWTYLPEEYYKWGYSAMPNIRNKTLIREIKKKLEEILLSIKNELDDYLP